MVLSNGAYPGWETELQTVETMIYDRGWSQIKVIYQGTDPILICTCRNTRGDLVLIFLSSENKVGVRVLRKMQSDSLNANSQHCILLSINGLTPFANKELLDAESGGGEVEIFRKCDLCMPITRHCLVPQHTPLTKAQKNQLLTELGCKAAALPKLKESDAVAKYLQLKAGTVVKIARNIGNLESEPYFRVVVP